MCITISVDGSNIATVGQFKDRWHLEPSDFTNPDWFDQNTLCLCSINDIESVLDRNNVSYSLEDSGDITVYEDPEDEKLQKDTEIVASYIINLSNVIDKLCSVDQIYNSGGFQAPRKEFIKNAVFLATKHQEEFLEAISLAIDYQDLGG